MERRTYQDIMALKARDGRVLGFHARKLEVAELSPEAWPALEAQTESEALTALQAWNAEATPAATVDPSKKPQASFVRSLSINVTQVCNLHCVYCAAGGDGTYGAATKRISIEKTLPQIQWLLERVPQDGTFSINFLGGEPLLYPEALSAIGEYALGLTQNDYKHKNIKLGFNVVTNGTLFNATTIAALKKINCSVTLSLDGPAEINDKVRPDITGKGKTAQILSGLQMLLAERKGLGSIGVQAVFGDHNCEVVKAYAFFRELGLDWYEFNFDQTQASASSSQKFERELSEVASLALATGGEVELRKIKFFDVLFSYLDAQKGIQNYCGSGKSYLVLDAQNRAFTCPWEVNDSSTAVGQGTQLALEKIQHLKTTQLEANNCGSCWARHLCGGGCMYAHNKATGSKHSPDRVYCERTRNLISITIMHYQSLRSEICDTTQITEPAPVKEQQI